jgi:D-alanyl-D-alanine carboxypeptidase
MHRPALASSIVVLVLALACSRPVETSAPPTAAAAAPSHEVSAEDAALVTEVDRIVDERVAQGLFSGVVVLARDGQPLLVRAEGLADRERQRANDPATRFDIASLGKMLTAVAIAQLVERGELAFEQPIGRYLPDFPHREIAERVTIEHLLTHRSGIPDLPEDLFRSPPAELRGYLPFFRDAALEFAPGTKRSYSNSGFVLLGLVIEQVSGRSYEDHLREHVLARAGMRDVVFRRADARDVPAAIGYTRASPTDPWTPATPPTAAGPHGGALATASDLVAFLHALRRGELVSPDTARRITTAESEESSPYGFGELVFARDRLVGHSGGDTGAPADAYTYWESGYTIVVLSNLAPPASHEVAGAMRELIEPRFE